MKGGRRRRGLFRGVRKAAKKVGRVARKVDRAVNQASKNRFVKAARRAADYGVRLVPIAGQAYSAADYGIKATKAARKGQLGSFLAKQAAQSLFEIAAPQTAAAVDYRKAQAGVAKALITGKGNNSKAFIVRKRSNK